jgi:small-conductance mechanosensitive channel
VSVVIFTIALMMIVAEIGFDLAPLIAGTSIVGVALGFGAQNVVKDFLSGMFMIFEDQYGVGDVIDFEKATGTVEAVGLRTTRLRDFQGTVWYVRNGEVVRVGNKSQGFAQVVLDVPIDAYADVELASAAMLQTAQALHDDPDWTDVFLSEPEVQGVESMTLDETVIRLVVRVRPLEQWKTARELRGRIRERLDQLHIAASDPQTHTDDPAPEGESEATSD